MISTRQWISGERLNWLHQQPCWRWRVPIHGSWKQPNCLSKWVEVLLWMVHQKYRFMTMPEIISVKYNIIMVKSVMYHTIVAWVCPPPSSSKVTSTENYISWRCNLMWWSSSLIVFTYTGGIPPDGTPLTGEVTYHLALVVTYDILAAVGIAFTTVCLVFNFAFRNRKLELFCT